MAIELLQGDCMDYMRNLPDKAFDLAIVDPPYAWGKRGLYNIDIRKRHSAKIWNDIPPDQEYFNELFRVSANQIVWGGNYFNLPPTRCFIFWNKHQPIENYADGELAWTSFDQNARMFDYGYTNVINYEPRIHPTQKPIKLYQWLLQKYAKEGQKILDTHLGSGSSAIAAHYGGFDFVGIELDEDYYKAARERFDRETAQVAMF